MEVHVAQAVTHRLLVQQGHVGLVEVALGSAFGVGHNIDARLSAKGALEWQAEITCYYGECDKANGKPDALNQAQFGAGAFVFLQYSEQQTNLRVIIFPLAPPVWKNQANDFACLCHSVTSAVKKAIKENTKLCKKANINLSVKCTE